MLKFNKKFFMVDCVESFTEVNENTNCMVLFLSVFNYLIDRVVNCMTCGMVRSETKLFIVDDVVCVIPYS